MRRTPLGNRYAITALKDKRATLAGEIDSLKKQIEWKIEQLGSVDATLALFDPEYQQGDIRPRKAYARIHLFKQGELSRTVLGVLREAGEPTPLANVVAGVMAQFDMAEYHRATMKDRVAATLSYLQRSDKVAKVGAYQNVLWALVEGRRLGTAREEPRALAAPKRK